MRKNDANVNSQYALLQSKVASLRNMEMKIGQLATYLKNRTKSLLPSNTEQPKIDENEQSKALTLRSGKVLLPAHLEVEQSGKGLIEKGMSDNDKDD